VEDVSSRTPDHSIEVSRCCPNPGWNRLSHLCNGDHELNHFGQRFHRSHGSNRDNQPVKTTSADKAIRSGVAP
jgi:hypothetical protein